MKKSAAIFMAIFLSIILSIALCGCAPATGEARIKLPKDFKKHKSYSNLYMLPHSWYKKTINFRDYVTVNNNTTWVLSLDKTGTKTIDDFQVTLGGGTDVYYVVCFDRIGLAKSYPIALHVEYKIVNMFFLEFDLQSLRNDWSYYYDHRGDGLGFVSISMSRNAYYLSNWDHVKDQISREKYPTQSTFYEKVTGLEYALEYESEETYFPSSTPEPKSSFKEWIQLDVSLLGEEPSFTSAWGSGADYYTIYVASWK